ncbi:MAG: hypoxanthine phosphoribosyltransferase [Brevinema sp.]
MNLKTMISEEEIARRVDQIATEINSYINGQDAVIVANLKGSVIFYADLFRKLKGSVVMDFIETQSYEGETSTGHVKIIRDLSENVEGRRLIFVEDILDTGLTFEHLLKHIRHFHKPSEVKICVLLDKPANRKVEIVPDWKGFEIQDQFVLGYGLDYDQLYRNLPYIAYKEK